MLMGLLVVDATSSEKKCNYCIDMVDGINFDRYNNLASKTQSNHQIDWIMYRFCSYIQEDMTRDCGIMTRNIQHIKKWLQEDVSYPAICDKLDFCHLEGLPPT